MTKIVKSITRLFTGGGDDAAAQAAKAAKKQQELQKIANDRALQSLNAEERRASRGRPARGRRLLIADETGESGLRSTLG